MRTTAPLAAVPLLLGCVGQSPLRVPVLPSDAPLHVRLHQPAARALIYELSEPAYVAVFSVARGHGISLVYPHFQSQVDHRSHAGLNQETVPGGSGSWGYSSGSRYEHATLFGFADAYFVVASKYPLPVEGMVQAPSLLPSLVGENVFRSNSLNLTWTALEEILVAGLPDGAWAPDVYFNWRDDTHRGAANPRAAETSARPRSFRDAPP